MDSEVLDKLEELRKKRESSINRFDAGNNTNDISYEDDSMSMGIVDINGGDEKILLEKPKVNTTNNKKIIKEGDKKNKKEITKEMIYKYMSSKGTKNSQIQDVIYEQAIGKVGNNNNKIAKVIVEFYKK